MEESSENINKSIAQTRAQVDEVVTIMRANVEKILERDERLSELDQRAEELQDGAMRFNEQAIRVKRRYWWNNVRMMLIIGVVGLVFLTIIIIWAS